MRPTLEGLRQAVRVQARLLALIDAEHYRAAESMTGCGACELCELVERELTDGLFHEAGPLSEAESARVARMFEALRRPEDWNV